MIQKNFTGIQRLIEYLRLDILYARSAGFWMKRDFLKCRISTTGHVSASETPVYPQ